MMSTAIKKTTRKITGIVLLIMLFMSTGCKQGNQSRSYYISPEGSDNNSGLSRNASWASIERVNRATFKPGDAIFFKKDGYWKGQLRPQGNGEQGKPITIGSYGKGSKPVINIGDSTGTGIQLINQSWWEIEGIEITSGAPPQLGVKRQGIVATVEGEGQHMEHIVIRGCYIHDIWGQVGGRATSIAIQVGKLGRRTPDCYANDILVENNRIERFDKVGIRITGDSSIVVRGNYMENLGGDGIIVGNAFKGLVEFNVADRTCLRSGDPDLEKGGETWWNPTAAIWLYGCTETVMQFNEVYNTGRQPFNGDGNAYDFDFNCKKCILQYNYSAYNLGGWLLIMERTSDNIARYNISQNDEIHLVEMRGPARDGNLIYNNLFYVDHGTLYIDYFGGKEDEKDSVEFVPNYRNNIFYATGQGRFRTINTNSKEFEKAKHNNRQFGIYWNNDLNIAYPAIGLFERNCYYGTWKNGLPDDPQALVKDPMLIAPGTGGIGLSTLNVYKLRPESQCINAGVFIEMDSKRDFFGNPVNDGSPDIGAFEKTR